MSIIPTKRMIFGRGLFSGADIVAPGKILVPDVTYLAVAGLTLLPDGRIQVTSDAGAGEWLFDASVCIASASGSQRTNIAVWLTYNGAEIPSTRRYVYARLNGYGSTASMYARLTNLNVGDIVGLYAFRGGTDLMRVIPYGISGSLEKVER